MKPIGSSFYNVDNFSLRLMLAVVSFVTFGLSMAQIFTNLYTKDGIENWVRWGVWQYKWCNRYDTSSCVESDLPMDMCSEWEHRQRSAQAFSVMVCIVGALCGIICWVDFLGFSKMLNLSPILPVASQATLCVFSLIQWAIVASTFHKNMCGLGSLGDNGYRLSASFSLTFCIFFSTLVACSVYTIIRYIRPRCA